MPLPSSSRPFRMGLSTPMQSSCCCRKSIWTSTGAPGAGAGMSDAAVCDTSNVSTVVEACRSAARAVPDPAGTSGVCCFALLSSDPGAGTLGGLCGASVTNAPSSCRHPQPYSCEAVLWEKDELEICIYCVAMHKTRFYTVSKLDHSSPPGMFCDMFRHRLSLASVTTSWNRAHLLGGMR